MYELKTISILEYMNMRSPKLSVVGVCLLTIASTFGIPQQAISEQAPNTVYYPNEVVKGYLLNCIGDGGKGIRTICMCTIEAFENKYSLGEFKKIQAQLAVGEVSNEVQGLLESCATK